MKSTALPDMYLLDALADDVEDVDSILRMLNSDTVIGWHKEWGRDFTRPDVVEGLSRLIRRDLVQVFLPDEQTKAIREISRRTMPPGNYDEVYFGITERGRLVHCNWDPEN